MLRNVLVKIFLFALEHLATQGTFHLLNVIAIHVICGMLNHLCGGMCCHILRKCMVCFLHVSPASFMF